MGTIINPKVSAEIIVRSQLSCSNRGVRKKDTFFMAVFRSFPTPY